MVLQEGKKLSSITSVIAANTNWKYTIVESGKF
jgi:hypothetical protein